MLDNMAKPSQSADGGVDVSMLRAAVERIAGAVETEVGAALGWGSGNSARGGDALTLNTKICLHATQASGNVTLSTVRPIAGTGVTYVSVGALTHSVTALDISLKITTQ
jgi:nicotinate-nucleotide pyrophosphorylase (carboxylating)